MKSLGALGMIPWGERALGMCSSVTAVGRMGLESRMTAKPWEPRKAQQFPGLTSGYAGKKGNGSPLGISSSFIP